MRRPTILIVGDAAAPTGYSRTIRSIFSPLRSKFHLVQLATRFGGGEHDYPWRLIPARSGPDPYGWRILPSVIDDVRPDVLFLLYDLGYQAEYLAQARRARHRAAVVIYSPIEGGPIEPELLYPMREVSRYVVFSDAARDIVKSCLGGQHWTGPPMGFEDVDVIPHGVDIEAFHPLHENEGEARLAGRRALDIDLRPGGFLVLNGNRNLPKKRLDLTIEGFSIFARDKPDDVKLLMHSGAQGQGWNLAALARRHGIAGRLLLSAVEDPATCPPDAMLNALYNAADVGINTSNSEGWGLVSFEHAAARGAQIVPDTPCLRSLWGDAAVFLPSAAQMTYPADLTTGVVVSPYDLAQSLERLYHDEAFRCAMAARAWERANDPDLRWEAIARHWHDLFCSLLEEAPKTTASRGLATDGAVSHGLNPGNGSSRAFG